MNENLEMIKIEMKKFVTAFGSDLGKWKSIVTYYQSALELSDDMYAFATRLGSNQKMSESEGVSEIISFGKRLFPLHAMSANEEFANLTRGYFCATSVPLLNCLSLFSRFFQLLEFTDSDMDRRISKLEDLVLTRPFGPNGGTHLCGLEKRYDQLMTNYRIAYESMDLEKFKTWVRSDQCLFKLEFTKFPSFVAKYCLNSKSLFKRFAEIKTKLEKAKQFQPCLEFLNYLPANTNRFVQVNCIFEPDTDPLICIACQESVTQTVLYCPNMQCPFFRENSATTLPKQQLCYECFWTRAHSAQYDEERYYRELHPMRCFICPTQIEIRKISPILFHLIPLIPETKKRVLISIKMSLKRQKIDESTRDEVDLSNPIDATDSLNGPCDILD